MDRDAVLQDIETLWDFLGYVTDLLEDIFDAKPAELDSVALAGAMIRGWREELDSFG